MCLFLNYNSLTSGYPFLVRNTVITGRDFTTAAGYPSAWPSPATLKAYSAPPTVFDPPFNIQNYAGAGCKDGEPPYAGILLDSVGADTSNTDVYSGVALPTYYTDITVGDTTPTAGNTYQNLFDNFVYGINATNSNLDVVNNAFINLDSREEMTIGSGGIPTTITVGGDGVYAIATNDAVNHDRLRVWSPGGNIYHNLWYGFTNGVECYNYLHIIGQDNYMINKNTGVSTVSPSIGASGLYGFLVKSAKYDTVDISNDTIDNINSGVAFWALQDPSVAGICCASPPWQYAGLLNITGNLIQANPLGYTAGMTQRVNIGISVQNALAQNTRFSMTHSYIHTNEVNISHNTMNDVYNGIYINYFWQQRATTLENNIFVRPNLANPSPLQYGINYTYSDGGYERLNIVSGSPAAGTAVMKDSLRGFYNSSNSKLFEYCNTSQNIGRGFEFYIGNPGTQWLNNTMTNNTKGMVLNGAVIGTQGMAGYPANDQWTPGAWSLATPETFVYHGANPINDTIYVQSIIGSTTNPIFNVGIPSPYAPGYGLAIADYYEWPGCPETGGGGSPAGGNGVYEQMAQQEILYDFDVIPNNWMGQFKLWQTLLIDSSLLDSSAVLQVFDSMAQSSRFAWLTAIEEQIALGNFDSANALMSLPIDFYSDSTVDSATQVKVADNTHADNIVQNYLNFYTLYMQYIADTLSSTDSLQIMALAQLCPERNGTVVYQARALYSAVYSDLSIFNDDSCMDVDSTYSAERHANSDTTRINNNGQQDYSLYPNPNDGNFTVIQKIPDNLPVLARIWNATGNSVFSHDLNFIKSSCAVNINNLPPGLYLLELNDSKGEKFTIKFILDK